MLALVGGVTVIVSLCVRLCQVCDMADAATTRADQFGARHAGDIADVVPAALLLDVVQYFRPSRVILFGSTVSGKRTADSDLDLAVIVPDDAPDRLLHWRAANDARRGQAAAVDILVFRRSAFDAAVAEVGSLPWAIARDGRSIYEGDSATLNG